MTPKTTVSLLPWRSTALLTMATAATLSPALTGGFVWDDKLNILNNPYFRGLGPAQLSWMLKATYFGPYQPLTWLTFGVDYCLWGLDPFGYHLVNILLHCCNAALFGALAVRLLALADPDAARTDRTGLHRAAASAVLLFSVHPLRVEAVAWVTERRTVLAGLFYLISAQLYLLSCEEPRTGDRRSSFARGGSIAAFALSLLAKGIGVCLPITLLTLDYFPLRRWGSGRQKPWPVLVEKAPYFAVSLAFGAAEIWSYAHSIKLRPLESYGLGARLAQCFYGLTFYLWKTLIPAGLSARYDLPSDLRLGSPSMLASVVAVTAASALFLGQRVRRPAALAAWIHYVATLLPVLGLLQFGNHIAADRYTYLPCLAWPLLAAGAVWRLRPDPSAPSPSVFPWPAAFMGLVIAALAALRWRQTRVWHDEESLWGHAVAVDPRSASAHEGLGVALALKGKTSQAIEEFKAELRLSPKDATACYNIGNALVSQGRLDEAGAQYRRALGMAPRHAGALHNLANVEAAQGRIDEALSHYREALEVDPSNSDLHYNLGNALSRLSRMREAAVEYRKALAIRPDYAPAAKQLARIER